MLTSRWPVGDPDLLDVVQNTSLLCVYSVQAFVATKAAPNNSCHIVTNIAGENLIMANERCTRSNTRVGHLTHADVT